MRVHSGTLSGGAAGLLAPRLEQRTHIRTYASCRPQGDFKFEHRIVDLSMVDSSVPEPDGQSFPLFRYCHDRSACMHYVLCMILVKMAEK